MLEHIKNPLMRSIWKMIIEQLGKDERKTMIYLLEALDIGRKNAQDVNIFKAGTLQAFAGHWDDLTANQLYTMAFQLLQEGFKRKDLEIHEEKKDEIIENHKEGTLCL